MPKTTVLNVDLFEFRDYQVYLNAVLDSRPRGAKARFAQAIRCHPTYASQVLSGAAHLSLEQAELAGIYLEHRAEESHFFNLLVMRSRAGTVTLRKYFADQIEEILQKRLFLKNRLSFKKTLTTEDQMIYYSAWYYAAIHVCTTLPHLRTLEAISEYLAIPPKKTREVLRFLVAKGLVTEVKPNQYRIGMESIHLGNDSPMVSKHHTNWRIQAIASLESESPHELHYSSVVGLSRSDMVKIKSALVKAIEEVRLTVKASGDEILCVYALDFFELGRRDGQS